MVRRAGPLLLVDATLEGEPNPPALGAVELSQTILLQEVAPGVLKTPAELQGQTLEAIAQSVECARDEISVQPGKRFRGVPGGAEVPVAPGIASELEAVIAERALH